VALVRRQTRVLSPTGFIRRRALDRVLAGDDKLWESVFIMLVTRRLMRRVMGSEPKLVAVEKLKAGQKVEIAAIDGRPPRSRRRRR
jgi:hypothetical protein